MPSATHSSVSGATAGTAMLRPRTRSRGGSKPAACEDTSLQQRAAGASGGERGDDEHDQQWSGDGVDAVEPAEAEGARAEAAAGDLDGLVAATAGLGDRGQLRGARAPERVGGRASRGPARAAAGRPGDASAAAVVRRAAARRVAELGAADDVAAVGVLVDV